MHKKVVTSIKNFIKEEYKFLIILLVIYVIFEFPVNYYIIVGGGSSDVSSRVKVEDKYNSKGSFNISYVTELKGKVLSYCLSFLIPNWERESVDLYKYNETESIDDVEFRSDLDLKSVNGRATYWAYTLANKEVKEISSKLYIITVYGENTTGLKVKDEILSIDDREYKTVKEYVEYLQTLDEDDYVNIKVLRNKKEKVVKVKLVRDEDTGRLVIGVGLQQVKEYETDPNVKIKFKSSESGPSGGLITTLEIYNQLTEKDLTKGKKIVGTGTIEENGTIGEIGGVKYKLLGASDDKADIFLVPSGENYKEALDYKKEKKLKIKIIEVKTIQDAIDKLEKLK